MDQEVMVFEAAGVLTLQLNRPSRKNALTSSMYSMLVDGLDTALERTSVKVVLIDGGPAAFCAGNDIGDFLENPPAREDSPVFRFMSSIATFPLPIVAAVCGAAVGVGTTMLLHCDLVVAGDNAQFRLPFVDLGLCPEAGSSFLLPQVIGHRHASRALFLGDALDARAAMEMGLINEVVPASEVATKARQWAVTLASKPANSVLETKRLIKAAQQPLVAEQIRREAEVFRKLVREPDAIAAMTSFRTKRKQGAPAPIPTAPAPEGSFRPD